jgi:hypothetical protein
MRKVLWGALLWTLLCAVPLPAMARTSINVSIGLPPPMVFARPPELVVLPGSYVYVAPDVAEDIYFHNGWWWRPWGGHWYRSRQYNSGWTYYRNVPAFYRGIPSGWRNDYRASMGASSSTASSTAPELEELGKKQALGEAGALGCSRYAPPVAVTPTLFSGDAIPAVPVAPVRRGSVGAATVPWET